MPPRDGIAMGTQGDAGTHRAVPHRARHHVLCAPSWPHSAPSWPQCTEGCVGQACGHDSNSKGGSYGYIMVTVVSSVTVTVTM